LPGVKVKQKSNYSYKSSLSMQVGTTVKTGKRI